MKSGSRKSLILLAVCMSVMSALLATVSWLSATFYEPLGPVSWPPASLVKLEALTVYLSVFLITEAVLISGRSGFALAAMFPAALLIALTIVFGSLDKWLTDLSFASVMFFGMFGPLGTTLTIIASTCGAAYLTALITDSISRMLTRRSLRGLGYDSSTFTHAIGFALGALTVFFLDFLSFFSAINFGANTSLVGTLSFFGYLHALWASFLVAPALHLACVVFHRRRSGWPEGWTDQKRLIPTSLILFLIVGVARSITESDPLMLVAWLAHDLTDLLP